MFVKLLSPIQHFILSLHKHFHERLYENTKENYLYSSNNDLKKEKIGVETNYAAIAYKTLSDVPFHV